MRSMVYLSMLATLLVGYPITAQPAAQLSGKITDAATGEPLPGANIRLVDTLLGTTTDLEGQFVLPAVPAGTHQVESQYDWLCCPHRDLAGSLWRASPLDCRPDSQPCTHGRNADPSRPGLFCGLLAGGAPI
ncbi:MAG: carboxypeptidase-like regulatory domain-containing protein [Candidatus Latescibacteria bacterium]|nr:carboxypeptidase-like regulatory domain-containing protein [Candidatus Latescibacterota bacterium]